jgi:hypothetical protein
MKRLPFAIHTVQYNEVYGDLDVYATGYCTPDIPGTMYRSNGDPGDPPEPGECEFSAVQAYDADGKEVFKLANDINPFEPDWEALEEKAREDAFDREYEDFD